MALPSKIDIDIVLLDELEKAGGQANPKDIYGRVSARFPNLAAEDLQRTLKNGQNVWMKAVQWARQRLKDNGEIGSPTRGVWAITNQGRERLDAYRKATAPAGDSGRGRRKRLSKATKREDVNHDELARSMEKIGQAFGFETIWKPRANDMRPDKIALSAKRKTLDVGWQIANLAWVPIEVQVGGSVPDLMYRFNQVHQWSLRLIIVTVDQYVDEIREVLAEGSYPFRDKVIILSPKQVIRATRSLDSLLKLKEEIFAS